MAMSNKPKPNDYMDIDALIDKVSKLPIPDTEKADLLRKFKENMMNPDRGEIENLNRIQSKYSSLYPGGIQSSLTPTEFLPSINPNLPQTLTPSMAMMISPQGQMQPQMQSLMQPQQGLTVAHFEVLKNKMDSIQLELVDLLRHVKDYTQRYMNATRQQDMEKIDAYINGIFEVDKQLKRAEDQAAAMSAVEDAEAATAGPEKSTITRATDGIKNFLGGIGEGVSGITSFVSSTANIVNDTLSKKVLGGSTPSTTSTTTEPSTPTQGNITTRNNTSATIGANTTITRSSNSRGNIVSVDDYIQSNMNQINSGSPTGATTTSTNANNITSANNINAMATAKPETKKEETKTKVETAEGNQEDITAAINKLNDTMNADIANTVSQSQSGGSGVGRRENHLTRKIRMLRLRLTKRKLESQLLDNDSKTKYNSKIIKNKNNKINKKTKKHN